MKEASIIYKGEVISDQVKIADSFLTRFFGLMGKPGLRPGEGLFLECCSSIHCCFMRFTISVVYLTKDLKVLGVQDVKPWHFGHLYKETTNVLELPEGTASFLSAGDQLTLRIHEEENHE